MSFRCSRYCETIVQCCAGWGTQVIESKLDMAPDAAVLTDDVFPWQLDSRLSRLSGSATFKEFKLRVHTMRK